MNKGRSFLAALFFLITALLIISCGGGGGSSFSSTPATSPKAALSPSSVAFGNETVGVTSSGQTVTLTNTGNAALSISGISITGADASDFSQTNVCGTSLAAGKSCNIVVSFAPSAKGSRTASLAVADNASGGPQSVGLARTGVIPILSVSPTSATVLLGGTQTFALNTNASCTSSLFGSVPVAGSGSAYTATYTVPQVLPSAWTDTVSCTETADPTQTVPAQIVLEYPTPVITGTSVIGDAVMGNTLGTLFAPGPGGPSITFYGSGFLSDGSFNPLSDPQNLCSATLVNWGEVQISYALSYADFGGQCSSGGSPATWDPGFLCFTASDPNNGHGGGTSNIGRLAFLGDQDHIAIGNTDAFLIGPAASTVYKWKLTDGTSDGSYTVTPGTTLAVGTDNAFGTSGIVVVFTDTGIEGFDQTTNAKLFELDAASPGSLHGGGVGDGYAFFSSYDGTQGFPNALDVVDLTQPSLSNIIHVSVKGTPQNGPWDFQILNLNGNLTGVVWGIANAVLSTWSIPSLQMTGSLALPNIATSEQAALRGGWQLQVFNSGPSAGTAVLLSNYDQTLVYVNLNTMKEIRRVDLTKPFTSANPPLPTLQAFRIGKDEADGSIVVAFADPVNAKTVLYNVDANGNMTPLTATAPFLATGLQESSDGTQIYWGNRSTFAVTPKQ